MTMTEVIAGGGIALAGTVVTQVSAFLIGHHATKSTREDAATERKRKCLTELCDAAKAYRSELAAEAARSQTATAPTSEEQRAMRVARMDYEAMVHRVEPHITEAFRAWAHKAQEWALGNEGSTSENPLWDHCMKTSGGKLREYD